jgi:5'-3' exonuclease
MNQQRSRRFRTAQETQAKEEARTAAVAEWKGLSNCLQRDLSLIFALFSYG